MIEAKMEDPQAVIARSPMSTLQVLAVMLATALNALDGFDVLSISFAAPGIAQSFGIDKAALGVVLSMELIGMAVGSFLLGILADRIGRRPVMLGCLAIMACGMTLAATAGGIKVLSLYRLVTGFGIGGMLATTNAVVAEYANARRRNLAIAIMGGGYPLGAVVGGAIASALLASGHGWPTIFHFGAFATLCFLPLVWLLMPETVAFLVQRRPAQALERVNRLLARMGRTAFESLPEVTKTSRSQGVSRLFSADFAKVTIMLTLAYFLHIMTFYFLVKWVPKLVVDAGFPAAQAGSVLVWTNVGGATGSLFLSLLTQRAPVRGLSMAAMVIGAASVFWFGQPHDTLAGLALSAGCAGFFLNGATVGLYAMFAQSYPTSLRATGTGLIIGFGRGGAALGPILAGVLLQAGLQVAHVALLLGCGSLLGAMALVMIKYRETSYSAASA